MLFHQKEINEVIHFIWDFSSILTLISSALVSSTLDRSWMERSFHVNEKQFYHWNVASLENAVWNVELRTFSLLFINSKFASCYPDFFTSYTNSFPCNFKFQHNSMLFADLIQFVRDFFIIRCTFLVLLSLTHSRRVG
jgi:hypothetical protein